MQDQEPTTAAPAAQRIEAAAATLAGQRALNADAHLIDEDAGFFGLSDGMGDVPRSREVALAVLKLVRDAFATSWILLPREERTPDEAGKRLVLGITNAHAHLFDPNLPRFARIGASFAGLVACAGGCVAVAHVGSCRVYLLRRTRRGFVRLTDDHTVLAASELSGTPRSSDEQRASDARTLTQAIGATRHVKPAPVVKRWESGDIALLCSDGVSAHVRSDEIATMLFLADDLSDAARCLVQRAQDAGGRDDATVVVVRRIS